MRATQETRQVQLASSISASAAATGYGEVDYSNNAFLLLNVLATGSGTITLALSSGTATGAAGSAVSIAGATSVTANATGSYCWRLPNKVSKYVYASGSGSAGSPSWVATIIDQGLANSSEGATANRVTEG